MKPNYILAARSQGRSPKAFWTPFSDNESDTSASSQCVFSQRLRVRHGHRVSSRADRRIRIEFSAECEEFYWKQNVYKKELKQNKKVNQNNYKIGKNYFQIIKELTNMNKKWCNRQYLIAVHFIENDIKICCDKSLARKTCA